MRRKTSETLRGRRLAIGSSQNWWLKDAYVFFERTEFEKNIALGKKDFGAIEYLLRKGQRQLEIYSAPGIRNIMH